MKHWIIPCMLSLSLWGGDATGALHIGGVKEVLAQASKSVSQIQPKALKALIDNAEEFYLIDIREPDQLAHGEIFYFNYHAITRGYLEFQIENIIPDKKAPIVVYCCTGKRSLLAARSLKELGYTNVKSLQGGIKGWIADGLPLDTTYGEMVLKK